MALEGTLDDLRLPDILQTVAQQRKTGILTIQGEETIVAVSFLEGRVVAADSLEETVDERLARLLVRDGLVARGALADAAARCRDGEGRLADVLVAEGHLGRGQLLDALRSQTLDLLEDVVGWRRGEFKFYAGEQVSYEEGFEPISVEDLLIAWLDHPSFADEPDGPAAGGEAEGARTEEDSFAGMSAGAGWDAEASGPVPGRSIELAAGDAFAEPLDGGLGSIDLADEVVWPAVEEPVAPEATRPRPVALPPVAEIEPYVEEGDEEPEPEARPRRRAAAPPAWLPPILAAGLAAALLAALLAAPGRFLLPFPWQEPEREALAALQAQARERTVDRAAKTFFLLEGRYPESLEQLVALDLLEPGDVRTAAGEPLRYLPQEDSYRLGERSEAITGNFLLDPELFGPSAAPARAPLVLLD